MWDETAVTITDLNKKGTGIFLQRGLDSPSQEKPVGQISQMQQAATTIERK
jgi:hypothetical protein